MGLRTRPRWRGNSIVCLFIAMVVGTSTCKGALESDPAIATLSSVTIWNHVDEPILVHCHDQFTDLEPHNMMRDADYVFTFHPNLDGTTLYSCSFMWGLNRTQAFPVWQGHKVQNKNPTNTSDCGAAASKCLYKVTAEGFYLASPMTTSAVAVPGASDNAKWFFINVWKESKLK